MKSPIPTDTFAIAFQQFLDHLKPCMESQWLAETVVLDPGARVLEIGCGTGFITFFLAGKFPQCREFLGIDIHPDLIQTAEKHLSTFTKIILPPIPDIHFEQLDITKESIQSVYFDCIVANPPFFVAQASRPSPNLARRTARQDAALSPQQLFHSAFQHLQPGGRIVVVYPWNRWEEIQTVAENCGFTSMECKRNETIRRRDGGVLLMSAVKPKLF